MVFKKMSVSLTDYVIKPFLDLDDQPVVNGAHSSQKLNSIVSETCLQTIFYLTPHPSNINTTFRGTQYICYFAIFDTFITSLCHPRVKGRNEF